jgi:hypothetical protein
MDARLMLNAKYLKSADFGVTLPAEPILTIDRVEPATEQGDSGEDETWWVIHFREGCKPLKTINTNTRCLIECFGKETDNWRGKRVQFFAMPGTWFGERGTAVRIKAADIAQPITVNIRMRAKKGQKSKVTYEIGVLPKAGAKGASSAPPNPALERAWQLWVDAGWKQDRDGFKHVVNASTGKAPAELADADLEKFTAAVETKKRGPAEPGAGG